MPTLFAAPCPSGPVVVSTPEVQPYSGWPGRPAVELAEVLDVVERDREGASVSYFGFTVFTPARCSSE